MSLRNLLQDIVTRVIGRSSIQIEKLGQMQKTPSIELEGKSVSKVTRAKVVSAECSCSWFASN